MHALPNVHLFKLKVAGHLKSDQVQVCLHFHVMTSWHVASINQQYLLLLLLNVFDNAPVCRCVIDESWVRAVMWRVSEMQVSKV